MFIRYKGFAHSVVGAVFLLPEHITVRRAAIPEELTAGDSAGYEHLRNVMFFF